MVWVSMVSNNSKTNGYTQQGPREKNSRESRHIDSIGIYRSIKVSSFSLWVLVLKNIMLYLYQRLKLEMVMYNRWMMLAHSMKKRSDD